MVDFLMTERGILTYNGEEVVRAFEEIKPRFPIIIFTSHEGQAFQQVDNPNIIYDKSKGKGSYAEAVYAMWEKEMEMMEKEHNLWEF